MKKLRGKLQQDKIIELGKVRQEMRELANKETKLKAEIRELMGEERCLEANGWLCILSVRTRKEFDKQEFINVYGESTYQQFERLKTYEVLETRETRN